MLVTITIIVISSRLATTPVFGIVDQSGQNLVLLLHEHIADMIAVRLHHPSELLLGLLRIVRRPEVVLFCEPDHGCAVVPGREHVVGGRAAGLQGDVFDEVDGAVDAVHGGVLVGSDPFCDGDVADVGAEEEDVGRVGEFDVVIPQVVQKFRGFGGAFGQEVRIFMVLLILTVCQYESGGKKNRDIIYLHRRR